MEFRRGDVLRGGVFAWIAFMLMLLVIVTLTFLTSEVIGTGPSATAEPGALPLILLLTALLIGPIALVVIALALPLAGSAR